MRAAAAVADPVRRDILVLLREGPRAAGEIAERFPVSRPAISRHLRVLRESGLVHAELTGRQRVYTLDPGPLRELAAWLAQFESSNTWDQRLDALETEVHRARRDRARQRRPERRDDSEENTA
ncbi:regulatory ArsR family protein [Prauserella shujinwangii]|uniref:Regulatory ArsR family protein n=1 Tax=Prauserella shujinwangii TaxID=1453103 RepID=A0A2T0M1B3_9PSEU|nr:metalloregulator ArsR/SmtB family transcription factor [Prauserella shujinwangii]PRX50340.1 regulatory ArsR family protein [Prauserella shujinwangii]